MQPKVHQSPQGRSLNTVTSGVLACDEKMSLGHTVEHSTTFQLCLGGTCSTAAAILRLKIEPAERVILWLPSCQKFLCLLNKTVPRCIMAAEPVSLDCTPRCCCQWIMKGHFSPNRWPSNATRRSANHSLHVAGQFVVNAERARAGVTSCKCTSASLRKWTYEYWLRDAVMFFVTSFPVFAAWLKISPQSLPIMGVSIWSRFFICMSIVAVNRWMTDYLGVFQWKPFSYFSCTDFLGGHSLLQNRQFFFLFLSLCA